MGWISDRHMKQGGSLNSNPRNNGSQGGPLRKILYRERRDYVDYEVLECGHLQLPKSDIIGETQPVRRRCRKCKRNAPADVELPPV